MYLHIDAYLLEIYGFNIVHFFIIVSVWESMMKGSFVNSQTTNKSDQELTDPLGKYHKIGSNQNYFNYMRYW